MLNFRAFLWQMRNALTIEDVLEGRAVAPCAPAYETLFAVLPELAASQRGKVPVIDVLFYRFG